MEIPIKMDDLGVPLFSETPISNHSLFHWNCCLALGFTASANSLKVSALKDRTWKQAAGRGTYRYTHIHIVYVYIRTYILYKYYVYTLEKGR